MRAFSLTLLTRVGATAAAAAIAATGVLATASVADAATTHVRKLPTSVSVRKVAHPAHGYDTVSGVLRSHRARVRDKVVYLERKTATTKFVVVAHKITGRHGGVAFRVSPAVTTKYELVFRGTPNFRHSHSGVVTVRVKA
jgi:hypothetical protein